MRSIFRPPVLDSMNEGVHARLAPGAPSLDPSVFPPKDPQTAPLAVGSWAMGCNVPGAEATQLRSAERPGKPGARAACWPGTSNALVFVQKGWCFVAFFMSKSHPNQHPVSFCRGILLVDPPLRFHGEFAGGQSNPAYLQALVGQIRLALPSAVPSQLSEPLFQARMLQVLPGVWRDDRLDESFQGRDRQCQYESHQLTHISFFIGCLL